MRHFEFGKLNVIFTDNHNLVEQIGLDLSWRHMDKQCGFRYEFVTENLWEAYIDETRDCEIFMFFDNGYNDLIMKFLTKLQTRSGCRLCRQNNILEDKMIIFATDNFRKWFDIIETFDYNMFDVGSWRHHATLISKMKNVEYHSSYILRCNGYPVSVMTINNGYMDCKWICTVQLDSKCREVKWCG